MEKATRSLGKVAITVGGIHNQAESYNLLCLVSSTDYTKIYISKKNVPANIALTDTNYWIKLLDLGNSITKINTLMEELREELNKIRNDSVINDVQELKNTALRFKENYTQYDWGIVENMNNILEEGIYTDCSLGRPLTDYYRQLQPGQQNEELFTLIVLAGKETLDNSTSNGLFKRINEIISEESSEYSNLNSITTQTGSLGNYVILDETFRETYNSSNIDIVNPVFEYKVNVPNGVYNINYVLDTRTTCQRDSGVIAPDNLDAPYVRIVNNKTGNIIASYSLDTFSNPNNYKATVIGSYETFKTLNDIEVTDGELSISIYCNNVTYYNWWVLKVLPICKSVANTDYKIINQIAFSHITGVPYFRTIYSKDITKSEFPDTIFNDWIDTTPEYPIKQALVPVNTKLDNLDIAVHNNTSNTNNIDRRVMVLENLIKLNEDSDNIVDRLSEIYNVLKNITEDTDLKDVIDSINKAIEDTNKLTLTKSETNNKIKIGDKQNNANNTITLEGASLSQAGLMTKDDKVKLEDMFEKYITDLANPKSSIENSVITPWYGDSVNPTIKATFAVENTQENNTGYVIFNNVQSLAKKVLASPTEFTANWSVDSITKEMVAKLVINYTLANAINAKTITIDKKIYNTPVRKVYYFWSTVIDNSAINGSINNLTDNNILNTNKAANAKGTFKLTNSNNQDSILIIYVPTQYDNSLMFTSNGIPVSTIKYSNLSITQGNTSQSYTAYVLGGGTEEEPVFNKFVANDDLILKIE